MTEKQFSNELVWYRMILGYYYMLRYERQGLMAAYNAYLFPPQHLFIVIFYIYLFLPMRFLFSNISYQEMIASQSA